MNKAVRFLIGSVLFISIMLFGQNTYAADSYWIGETGAWDDRQTGTLAYLLITAMSILRIPQATT